MAGQLVVAGPAPQASVNVDGRARVPDPGVRLPAVALPTVCVWFGALAAFVAATWFALASSAPWRLAITVPVNVIVTFLMFTVLHESTHHAAGRLSWANEVFGRMSMPFVSAWGTFPFLKYIHIEHHRNTNEDPLTDPDAWTDTGPVWQLPLRWLVTDLWYFRFYLTRIARRPRSEVIGLALNVAVVTAATVACVAAGYGWELLVIFLIPQRLGIGLLGWMFDWLPHHDLGMTSRINRFHATRMRVGWEGLMTPVMMYQNYHLVHHIHPTIPFYRYASAWRSTEGDYLQRNVPIATAWGRTLSAEEYRAWRGITDNHDAGVSSVEGDRSRFHRLRVAAVRRLTTDSVSITFDVPDALRDTFRFEPGQHITVRAIIDGHEVRRPYSISTIASSGELGIAVKAVERGAFSTFANSVLTVGAELDVMPPAGQFALAPAQRGARHLAAVGAGSGITPLMSIIAGALTSEPTSRATLIYANRSRASTMFADELTMLVRQFDGRLRVLHVLSRDELEHADPGNGLEAFTTGRLDPDRIAALLADGSGIELTDIDEWYVCGPQQLSGSLASTLVDGGVARASIRCESYTSARSSGFADNVDVVSATAVVTLRGVTSMFTTEGDESLLEAALRNGLDVPYSCTGGACGTCRAVLRRGTVHMEQNYSLSEDDIATGAVLTCQSRPTSDHLRLDYDN